MGQYQSGSVAVLLGCSLSFALAPGVVGVLFTPIADQNILVLFMSHLGASFAMLLVMSGRLPKLPWRLPGIFLGCWSGVIGRVSSTPLQFFKFSRLRRGWHVLELD